MDKVVAGPLSGIPASALSLSLARSTIRMEHTTSWGTDKVNQVHDLVICLEGRGEYLIDDHPVSMSPGRAMLIRAGSRFVGSNPGPDIYLGIAQHFTLKLFDRHDLVSQMELQPVVQLSHWDVIEPMARHFRAISPLNSTTAIQYHMFMFILLDFLEDAFVSWRSDVTAGLGEAEGLALSIVLAATQISADPLDDGVIDRVLNAVPYNIDYFQREFRQRIGLTPRKYREFKRMERAMLMLQYGRSVTDTAYNVGYEDAYYFSRMFKRHIGVSPRGYQQLVERCREGTQPDRENGDSCLPQMLLAD